MGSFFKRSHQGDDDNDDAYDDDGDNVVDVGNEFFFVLR